MNIFPWASTRSTTRTSEKGCGALIQEVNEWLGRKSAEKSHAMISVVETDDCPCGGSGSASEGVELIVLIDSSGSMKTAATIISEIARDAEAQAIDTCDANAKVHYLFVDGNDRDQAPVIIP